MRTPTLYTLFLFLFFLQIAKAQIKINEVMALNTSGAYNPVAEEPGDWIEIYNGTEYLVDLAGYFLSCGRAFICYTHQVRNGVTDMHLAEIFQVFLAKESILPDFPQDDNVVHVTSGALEAECVTHLAAQ